MEDVELCIAALRDAGFKGKPVPSEMEFSHTVDGMVMTLTFKGMNPDPVISSEDVIAATLAMMCGGPVDPKKLDVRTWSFTPRDIEP